MTSNQYIVIFSIEITHRYYENGVCRDLHYIPSPSTQDLINRYALRVYKTPRGFSFYMSTNQDVKDFLNTIKTTEGVTSFSFDVTSSDPNFRSLTDYPISEAGIFSFYTPTEGNATTLERKFISDNTNIKSFIITIDFDAIIRFRESGNNTNYTIQLASRKTQWNYYIINKSNQTFEKLEIKGDSEISFGNPTEVTLQNGDKAYMFSSGSFVLPLKEKSEYSFDLVDVREGLNSTNKIILKGLPSAKLTFIETYIEENITRIASPIYIYL